MPSSVQIITTLKQNASRSRTDATAHTDRRAAVPDEHLDRQDREPSSCSWWRRQWEADSLTTGSDRERRMDARRRHFLMSLMVASDDADDRRRCEMPGARASRCSPGPAIAPPDVGEHRVELRIETSSSNRLLERVILSGARCVKIRLSPASPTGSGALAAADHLADLGVMVVLHAGTSVVSGLNVGD